MQNLGINCNEIGQVILPYLANNFGNYKLLINFAKPIKKGGKIMLTAILYLLCTLAFLPEAFNQKK